MMFQIGKKQIIKNTAFPCFFVVYYLSGLPPPNPTQRTFREKSFGISKAFQNKVVYFEQSSLAHLSPKERCVRIFKGIFQKLLEARFGTQFQHIINFKKRGFLRVFLCSLNVGAIRPKPRRKKLFEKSFFELQKLSPK